MDTREELSLVRNLLKAFKYATRAHGSQKRKYTLEPYTVHLAEVADLVIEAIPGNTAAHQAAVLHDVLEDTDVTEAMLRQTFSKTVVDLVLEVTDVSTGLDGNRYERKAKDREHLSKSSVVGASIKLADMISNTKDIVMHDPAFAKVYLSEKWELLAVLTHGNTTLYAQARQVLRESLETLNYGNR